VVLRPSLFDCFSSDSLGTATFFVLSKIGRLARASIVSGSMQTTSKPVAIGSLGVVSITGLPKPCVKRGIMADQNEPVAGVKIDSVL
jgi:hypothetical protein